MAFDVSVGVRENGTGHVALYPTRYPILHFDVDSALGSQGEPLVGLRHGKSNVSRTWLF